MRLRRSSHRKLEGFFRKSEGFFRESKVSSEEAEGFFRRALGLNTHKFQKRSAASLTDLPGLRLRLPELHLCLPSHVNNGKAEQQRKGFRKRASFLKMRTVQGLSRCDCHPSVSSLQGGQQMRGRRAGEKKRLNVQVSHKINQTRNV